MAVTPMHLKLVIGAAGRQARRGKIESALRLSTGSWICPLSPPIYTADMACDYRPHHRIYMSFFLRVGWYVSFLEPDLKTSLARTFNFSDPEEIRDLARRGGALDTFEAKQTLEQAIETGKGGLYLSLTEDQYRKLR
jgi:hypothetical protein